MYVSERQKDRHRASERDRDRERGREREKIEQEKCMICQIDKRTY